jgi:predicted dehydrogenase
MVTFRAGVVGVGARTVHGAAWARTLAEMPDVRLVRVSDDDAGAAEETARSLGVEHFGTDPRAVLEAADLDVVCVNSIDHEHAWQVAAALEAGKHVIADKPLGQSTAEVLRVAELAARTGLKVSVGHVFRFAPQYAFVKERVRRGELGKLFLVEAGYVHDLRTVWQRTPWRADPSSPQSPWYGCTLHPIDLVQWLAGEITEVCAVENKATDPTEHPLPDNQVCLLKFASGATGRVWSTAGIRQSPEFRTFCNAFGSRGSCLASLPGNPVELHADWGVPGVAGPQTVPFQSGLSLNRALLDDWIGAIVTDGAPRSGVSEALRSTAVIEAAMRSVATGRFERVVVKEPAR